jgi:hypothetical protein
VIDYETFCKIRLCYRERGLNFTQIARELDLHPETVAKYAALDCCHPRRPARRKSKLDPFKPIIQRWLERYPYSATQIFQRLQTEEGYAGGFSILKDGRGPSRPKGERARCHPRPQLRAPPRLPFEMSCCLSLASWTSVCFATERTNHPKDCVMAISDYPTLVARQREYSSSA